MKRALTLVLSLVLVLSLLPLAVSARTLTNREKEIFTELRSPAPAGDGDFVLPEVTIKKGENYLMALDEALTDAQIDAILSYVRDAEATVTAAGTGNVKNWTQATRDHVLMDIDLAAQQLGLRAAGRPACNGEHGWGEIYVYDPATGAIVVAEDELIVRKTGSDAASFAIAGACGLVVLCACAFVAKKVELF